MDEGRNPGPSQVPKRLVVNARCLALPFTGVQRYTQEICRRLPDDTVFLRPRRASGVPGHLWEQTVLPRQTRGRLLWSPGNVGPLAVRKQVVTVHDAQALDHPEWYSRQFAMWYGLLVPALVRRVSAVVTVSAFTRERLLERTQVDPSRVYVVPSGVDDTFQPAHADKVRVMLARFGLELGSYFLVVGSLVPRKNHERVVQAFRSILPFAPDGTTLAVIGDVGVRAIYAEAKLPEHDRVKYVGRIDDITLAAFYTGALAYVHASVYEGFGLPILEAMACGTPTLVANNTAGPEVAGDAALFMDPFDVDSIANGMLTLLRDSAQRERLAQRGVDRARQFTWEASANRTLAILAAAE